jgi:hypothetical protein
MNKQLRMWIPRHLSEGNNNGTLKRRSPYLQWCNQPLGCRKWNTGTLLKRDEVLFWIEIQDQIVLLIRVTLENRIMDERYKQSMINK